MKNIYYLFILVIAFINISNAQTDTIEVSTGWNIIGALYSGEIVGLSNDLTLDLIITEPPGIITSPFWGFDGAYYQADSLKRGEGYWVKVSQDGKIIYISYTDCGTVDYAGKIYNTIIIGDQCWLKENLDVGTMIDSLLDATDNGVIEKYCHNNDPNNCNIYGALYQWDELMQYSTTPGDQGICPTGWHIPTEVEYQTLSTAVGGNGNTLKEIGQGSGSGVGTNTSGFSSLPAGLRHNTGYFDYLGSHALFWTSTDYDATGAIVMSMYYSNSDIVLNGSYKSYGYSIRCLKN